MNPPTARELRDWANGKAPTGGRLPRALIVSWNAAHPDRQFPLPRSGGTWREKWADKRDP